MLVATGLPHQSELLFVRKCFPADRGQCALDGLSALLAILHKMQEDSVSWMDCNIAQDARGQCELDGL
jgi:hypothetical protein